MALERAREKLDAVDQNRAQRLTGADAIDRFLKDKIATGFDGEAISLEEAGPKSDTIRKLTDVFNQLRSFAESKRVEFLDDFIVDSLIAFRETWHLLQTVPERLAVFSREILDNGSYGAANNCFSDGIRDVFVGGGSRPCLFAPATSSGSPIRLMACCSDVVGFALPIEEVARVS